MNELMTVPDFLQRYSISRTVFYRLVRKGELPLKKLGRSSRISAEDAAKWASNLPTIGGRNVNG